MLESVLKDTPALSTKLPHYAFRFFFAHCRPFLPAFLALTAVSAVSTLLRFSTVYLLGDVVTRASSLDIDRVLYVLIPLWFAALFAAEALDYFTRRYSEAFGTVYSDWALIRLYRTVVEQRFHRLYNYSKERLDALLQLYVTHIRNFLNGWFWVTTSRATRLVLILGILAYQSPLILLLNAAYVVSFLALSLSLSSRFSVVAERFSRQQLNSRTAVNSLLLNLNMVRRLGAQSFFIGTAKSFALLDWARLDDVRRFHARRWLIQLNLFNLLFVGTLAFGIWQVHKGALPLGFLVLIKWSFDELWHILVYITEYYVDLVRQREDTAILNSEFETLFAGTKRQGMISPVSWRQIKLESISARFVRHSEPESEAEISVSSFSVSRGAKIGVVGRSGSGKSTVLNILLNVVDFSGSYTIDGLDVRGRELDPKFMTVVSSFDPLVKVSLRDNLTLGRQAGEDRLRRVLEGIQAQELEPLLDHRVGSPDFYLSTGQEQRIRLARGLLTDSDVLLLDEPLSGIDRPMKRAILEFLKESLKDKTLIVVTHHDEELELVNEVWRMEEGRLRPAV